jgi:hypothetical protein
MSRDSSLIGDVDQKRLFAFAAISNGFAVEKDKPIAMLTQLQPEASADQSGSPRYRDKPVRRPSHTAPPSPSMMLLLAIMAED